MSERQLKVKCIRDDGCQFWTEGNEYPAEFYIPGSLMIGDDDSPNAEWSASLTDGGELYAVDGLDYLAQFELLDSGE
ncbi:hypothetical protein AB7Y15_19095 [Morganella morganii]|uniref:hypothetical protein n=1 Tax=Morganella morganii TaxID=582 RepID=UPI0034E5D3C3